MSEQKDKTTRLTLFKQGDQVFDMKLRLDTKQVNLRRDNRVNIV